MPIPYSWVEVHGATTHFPIVLLMLACLFDIGAMIFKRPSWREMTLLMLVIAVASLPISLLSGYLAGIEYKRPPAGYDLHWMAAVATSVLAVIILAWRLASRDTLTRHEHLQQPARIAALMITMAGAASVSFTGFMGGQMVFGDRTAAAQAVAETPPAPDSSAVDGAKLGAAANRMASASQRLESATEKLGVSAAKAKEQLSKPAPVASAPVAAAPSAPATSPATDAKLSEIARAAQNLEAASARFEHSASKLERIASDLPSASSGRSTASSAPPKIASAPPAATSKTGTSAPAAPAKPEFDPALLVAGEKVLRDEEHGCLDCHKFNGEGRAKGTDLTFAGRLHGDIEWQIAHLKDPASKVPGSKMPAYDDKSEPDLRALSTFLASRK